MEKRPEKWLVTIIWKAIKVVISRDVHLTLNQEIFLQKILLQIHQLF